MTVLDRNPFTRSTPARKRLLRDFRRLQKEPPPGISGTPTESNIMFWQVRCGLAPFLDATEGRVCPQAVIFGPEDTPWEGGEPMG